MISEWISTEVKYANLVAAQVQPMRHHRMGLQWTTSGYGKKIPTQYMVRLSFNPRWLRVYQVIYSNVGSLYIESKGEQLFIRESELEELLESSRGSN